MRIATLLLPLSFASAAAASTLVVEVSDLRVTPAAPASAPSPARAEAEAVMAQRCALCHGARGRSDGIMSPTLQPRPRDLSDVTWQGAVSDAQIAKAILEGGVAVGKSAIMPAHPDLKQKPAVVEELVRLLRGFAKRGVVRASVVDEKGAVLARADAVPEPDGKQAVVRFSEVAPGSVTVRGWLDADEDGEQGAGEPTFERRGVEITAEEVRVTLPLARGKR